jgi:hypothetical protein
MKTGIETITCNGPARPELVRFLAGFENENRGVAFWQRRLAFWWDENPFHESGAPCGWVLRSAGEIAGFLGLIAAEYVWRGQNQRAWAATTWRVAREQRHASLPLFVKWHQLGDRNILLDTTPNAETVRVLNHFQYRSPQTLHRYFFPLRGAGRGLKKLGLTGLRFWNQLTLPKLSGKIVTLADTFTVHQGFGNFKRLEKHVTRRYLDWFCRSPETPKEFIGCVDERGALTSYLILQPEPYGEHEVLSVIDYFTTLPDQREVLSLIREVLIRPGDVATNHRFLMLNVLGEPFFPRRPFGVIHRQEAAKHYYSLPKPLADATKHCVLAEGDYGC